MPIPSLVFRVFVASPSDCLEERKLVREVATAWNAVFSLGDKAIIEPVFWESHSTPSLEDRGQAIINKQLVANCDIGIGIFWTRLGTPTGDHESGSVEEIEELRRAGKPVLLYFSSIPVEQDSVDRDEYERLKRYRSQIAEEGLVFRYRDLQDFRKLLQNHLTKTISDLLRASRSETSSVSLTPEPNLSTLYTSSLGLQFPEAINSFRVALGGLMAQWRAERNSEPLGIDEGKRILAAASQEAARLRSTIDSDTAGSAQTLDEATKKARALQKHELFMDGGESYGEFWRNGDDILDLMKTVPARMMAEDMRKRHRDPS